MATKRVGTIFVELDLDPKRYMRAQQTMAKEAKTGAKVLEKNFKNLGIKSNATFDLMRNQATQSFEAIKRSGKATANDLVRAEKAKSVKIKQINEQQFGHQKKMMTQLKDHWVGVAAGIYASMRIMQGGWELMKEAANFEQQEKAFDSLTASYGANGAKIIDALKRISSNTISTMILVEKAGTAMMMGIAPDKVIRLMEIARATARMTGQSVSDAFSDISLAVGRQSKMILDNLGIIVSVQKANEVYAASLGKTASQLDDTERKLAFMNATLSAGEDLMRRLGNQSDTTRDKMDRLATVFANLKLQIGGATLALVGFIEKMTDKSLDIIFGPITGDPKEHAKRALEKQLELAMRSYNIMAQQGNIDQKTLMLAEARIFTLRQRIDLLKESTEKSPLKLTIGGPGQTPMTGPDLWQTFGGGAREETSGWAQSAYGFNQRQYELIEDRTAEHFRRMKELTAGNKDEILAILAKQAAQEKAMQMKRLEMYQTAAGGIASTFLQISQAGGRQSKEAFKVYKAFAIVEAGIAANKAILQAMASYPPPWSFVMAGIAGAAAAVQIGLIAASQPPSYDQGGISSARGIYQTGNIDEAHIPLKSGKVPVSIGGVNKDSGTTVNITMENPTFQDVETQRQVFAQIAEIVATRVAPIAVLQNYSNDGPIRQMVRGRR